MSARYASDKRALAICDRCGFAYQLRELRNEIVKGRRVSTKVCTECYDKDHPQLFLGEYPVSDPQALRDPRPDSAELAASRGLVAPVRQLNVFPSVGTVTVVVT